MMTKSILSTLALTTLFTTLVTSQATVCRPQYNTDLIDNMYAATAYADDYVAYQTEILASYYNHSIDTLAQLETHKFVYDGTTQSIDYSWVLAVGSEQSTSSGTCNTHHSSEYCTGITVQSNAIAWNNTNYNLQYHTCADQCISNVTESWLALSRLSSNQSGATDIHYSLTEQYFADAFYNDPAFDSGAVGVGGIDGTIVAVLPGYYDVILPIALDRCINHTCLPICMQFNESSCTWSNTNINTIYTPGACTIQCQLYDFTGQGITSGGALFQVGNLEPTIPPTGYVASTPPPTPNNTTNNTNNGVPAGASEIVISLVGTMINASLCDINVDTFKSLLIADLVLVTGGSSTQFTITNVVYNEYIQSIDVYLAITDIVITATSLHKLAYRSLATSTGTDAQSIIDGLYYDTPTNTASTSYLKYADFKSIRELCSTGAYSGYYTTTCLVDNLSSQSSPSLVATQSITQNQQPDWIWIVIGILAGLLGVCLIVIAYLAYKRKQQLHELSTHQHNNKVLLNDVESANYNYSIPVEIGHQQNQYHTDNEIVHTPSTITQRYIADENVVEQQ